jgi:hypothetical protein
MTKHAPNSWEARSDRNTFYGFSDLPSIHERGATVLSHGKGVFIYDVHGR